MLAAGIDLGTSYLKIGVFKNGKVQIIPNSIGDQSTPSIVSILDNSEAIGEEAMIYKADEKHQITQIKRLIGKNINDLNEFKDLNYDIAINENKLFIKVNRKGKEELIPPEYIISLFFRKLIKDASEFMEKDIKKAVIAVPAYFDPIQRSVIEESAKLAEIEILEIINEPTAAALSYGLGTKENLTDSLALSLMKKDNKKIRNVLVFDLGGGTLDVSVLTIENTNFFVKATLGDPQLGGIDFDKKLINYCLKKFCDESKINENEIRKDLNAVKRLNIQCERAKKTLSKSNKAQILVYNFYQNNDLHIDITVDDFNRICNDFFIKIENILDKILIESKFSSDKIDDIILVGGSSKIPKIREILERKFDPNKIRNKINSDEAVVTGATWKANKLVKNSKEFKVLDVTPSSFGVGSISKNPKEKNIGLTMSVLIAKGTPIPCESKKKIYQTYKKDQSYFKIKVFSGEKKFVKDNKFLGETIIDNLPPGEAKSVELTIWFKVDINGKLYVNAEVKSIGKIETLEYPIYNNESQVKKSINQLNTSTIIKLKKNPESNKKLNEIKNLSKNIVEKNNYFNNTQNNDEKNSYLKELCDNCLKIVNIYSDLRKNIDSENLYEKSFYYTKLLFYYYSKMLIFDKDNNNDNEKNTDIIKKIKEEIVKHMDDDIENILEAFEDLKNDKLNFYIEIILYIVGILYDEGKKILDSGKRYSNYYSKKFFKKAETIKKYLDDKIKEKIKHNFKLKGKVEEFEEKYGKYISTINDFIYAARKKMQNKTSEFLPNKTGKTVIFKKLDNVDDLYFQIDIFQEMAEELNKSKIDPQTEAYCYANIIIINFKYLNNKNFDLYEDLNSKIGYIMDRLHENDDEDEEEPEWYKNLAIINQQIDTVKKLYEEEERKKQDAAEKIEELNNVFNNKIKEQKPMEFIEFILEKYPLNNLAPSIKEKIKENNLDNILKEIIPKYHPDNAKDKFHNYIYHQIYILLDKLK